MKHFEFEVESKQGMEIINITPQVRTVVKKSETKNGIATIFTSHTTAAIAINENEENLKRDALECLQKIVPAKSYRHDIHTVDDRQNARSHIISMLLQPSLSVPIIDGELALGTWQSIFFLELDGPRRRKILVQIIGE